MFNMFCKRKRVLIKTVAKNENDLDIERSSSVGNSHIRSEKIQNATQKVYKHRCRSNSPYRVYLPCDLNIKKLWKLYNGQAELIHKVKHCYFRKYFNTNYNDGFGTPQTDQCSACLRYKVKIKKCLDPSEKQSLTTNYRVHKLQAKSFYTFIKQSLDEIVNVSFDCQKNLAMPKLPDQQAYVFFNAN
nr:unnamed protein product [Callosobruchus analis]